MKKSHEIGQWSRSDKKIGVVIYDSAKGTIVSEGYDCRSSQNILHHAVIVALNRLSRSQGGTELMDSCELLKTYPNPNGYLCTGFDVYVSAPPCLMCSMALVHSRISRLFYKINDSIDGNHALDDGVSSKSVFKLFAIKSLNHSFHVFEINH